MSDIFEDLSTIGGRPKEALVRFMNDKELYLKYVRDYPEEPTMGIITKAVEEKDYATAKSYSHALKGVLHNLGFMPLADAMTDMNEELKDDNVEDALIAYDEAVKQYDIFVAVIRKWRETETPQN